MWLLLHGFTGAPASWEPVLDEGDFDPPIVTPFLLGHGLDWRAHQRSTFDAEVDRLAELVAGTEAPRFLAGYSLGARVGLVLLSRHPMLFSGAVLIGARTGLEDLAARDDRREEDARRASVLRGGDLHAFLDAWEKQPLFDTQQSLPERILATQRMVREGHDAEGLAQSLEVLGLGAMPPSLDFESVPVTLMVGDRDEKFSRIAHRLAEAHPNRRAVLVPGAGHNLLLEAPSAVAGEMARMAEGGVS